MATYNPPTVGADFNAWGSKLNDTLSYLKETQDATTADVASVTGDAAAAQATADTAVTNAASAQTSANAAQTTADGAVTAAGQKVAKGALIVNAKDYGALGDGVADDRSAIQSALDAATGQVLLPPGDYLIGSGGTLNVPTGISLVGHGQGVSRIVRGGSGGNLVGFAGGSLGSTKATLTADAAIGASTLTVDSTATLVVGEWLLLRDDRAPDPDKPTRPGGELVQVASIASGTSVVLRTTYPGGAHASYRGVSGTFDDAATDGIGSYLVSSNAKLVGVTLSKGQGLRDLSLVNPTPGTGNGMGVNATYTDRPVISGVEITGIDGTGINFAFANAPIVSDCYIHDLVDDPGNSRYGYGVNITGASQDAIISGCTFERLRHAVTTDGNDSGGIPRRITVANCRAYQTHETSFDTHGAGYDILFDACVSVESSAYAFSNRARNVTFRGCQAIRPTGYGFNCGALPARRVIIDSCVVRDGGTSGVRISGHGIHGVTITNLFVDGVQEHGVILGYGNARQTVTNSRFFNIGQSGNPFYGITFVAGDLGTVDAPNTIIAGNLFVKNKTYGAATNYNAAVNIGNAALTAASVFDNRATGIYTGGSGWLLNSGTSTVFWGNARLDAASVGTNTATATTTQLASVTSQINLTKRKGMIVYNTTTNKPVWSTGDTAASTWVDGTGATAHTPV